METICKGVSLKKVEVEVRRLAFETTPGMLQRALAQRRLAVCRFSSEELEEEEDEWDD